MRYRTWIVLLGNADFRVATLETGHFANGHPGAKQQPINIIRYFQSMN